MKHKIISSLVAALVLFPLSVLAQMRVTDFLPVIETHSNVTDTCEDREDQQQAHAVTCLKNYELCLSDIKDETGHDVCLTKYVACTSAFDCSNAVDAPRNFEK